MRNAAFRNTLRSIWRTRSRYFSILLIVALGVGFFAGIKASRPDMIRSTDIYSDRQNLMHFRVVSTWGFDAEDIAALRAQPGATVQPSYYYDSVIDDGISESEARLIAYRPDNTLNKLWLKDGRLPTRPDECVVDNKSSYEPGTKLRLVTEGAADNLSCLEFTVVGRVYTAMYVSDFEHGNTTVGDGAIDHILFVPDENFTSEYYTEVYLVFSDLTAETVYTKEYDEAEARHRTALEELGLTATADRKERTLRDADEQIRTAELEIEDGKVQLSDGRRQLDDAKQLLEDGAKALADVEPLLTEKRAELEDAKAQLAAGEAEYKAKSAEAAEGAAKLIEARREYTEGFEEYTAKALEAEKQLAQAHEEIKSGELKLESARSELDNADTLYNAARAIYDEAFRAYSDLENRYEEISKELSERTDIDLENDAGLIRTQLDRAGEYLRSVEARLNESKAELDARRAEYEAYVAELEAAKAQYEAARSEADRELAVAEYKLSEAKKEIEAGEDLLLAGQAELAAARAQLDEAQKQIEAGEAGLTAAEQEFESKKAEYEAGLAEYEAGETEYAVNAEKLAAACAELNAKKAELAALPEPEWYVFTRSDNGGYAEYGENAERIGNIAKVFPAFFILVAALVSITAMTRMVSEERTQIGTLKALGYSGARILGKYMFYCLSATFLGCVLGLSVGFKLFPFVIAKAYSMLYQIRVLEIPFLWKDALIITGISLALSAVTVAFCCWKVMLPMPAKLMRPEAPAAGKSVLLERVKFIWKRLSFFRKVTVRNVFRYKKRMIMTLVGIMGCTALMLCGFGLRDSILDIVDKQFESVMRFDGMIVTQDLDETGREEIRTALHKYDPNASDLAAMQKSYHISSPAASRSSYVIVLEDAAGASGLLGLKNRTTGERYELRPGGALVTEKLAKQLDVKAGDNISVAFSDTHTGEVRVDGIIENYIYHYVYVLPETYEEMSGEAPEYNTVFVQYSVTGETEERMAAEILKSDQVLTMSLQSAIRSMFSKMMKSLNYVVFVLIFSAILLAVIVQYNLASINIAERTREIATLEVLGFRDGEVAKYIFRESIALSVIGALFGLGLGRLLADFVIKTAEIDLVMFGREVHVLSYVLAAALTIAFSVLVNLIMTRRVRKISMVEALKSVD